MNTRKNGSKTDRAENGQFVPGNSGRPKGARHKTTLAIEALLDGEGATLTRKAIELALAGDTVALRLCLERLCPARKDSPVNFAVPKMESAADASQAIGAILEAVGAGELTPTEASNLSGLIDSYRRALETEDLERRVTELENGR